MQGNAITMDLLIKFNMDVEDLAGVDIIVSFIKTSGYNQIEFFLKEALRHKVPIRVLTSTYMSITDPVALSKLLDLLGEGNVKLYNGGAPSFHPKAYFFKSKSDINRSYLLVGSSNISKPALTKGVEWNYQVNCSDDPQGYHSYQSQFEDLFNHHSYILTEEHIKEYRKTLVVQKQSDEMSRINHYYLKHLDSPNSISEERVKPLFQPNQPQEEALFELNKTREDGNDKALVVAATGVGKTFLAAFDSKGFDTILFIAHREEILDQAYTTFAKIRENKSLGRYYAGHKELDADIIFASVQTLSREEHLSRFDKKRFKYVIMDEFHHASASTYRVILNYFESEFLLGLTATPYRLDKKDVLHLCDYNIPYEADLFTAINRDWLVPFYYYGIYDETVEYENIRYIHGKYVDKELSKALSVGKRAELIFKHYMKHKKKSAVGFCVDINHAEEMTDYFKKQGIKAAALHSDARRKHYEDRKAAIQKLVDDELDILFAVDILNEGVDIPEIDLLLFLRPTESPTVFLQQLGRGLRHAKDKAFVKVLDFIGNYKTVDMLPLWISGQTGNTVRDKQKIVDALIEQELIPQGCYIDFDLKAIDLFARLFKAKRKVKDRIEELYKECQSLLGHVPTRVEFFDHLNHIEYTNIKKSSALNPFKDYLSFISQYDSSIIPSEFMDSDAKLFINMIETTRMEALYKIPVIQAFLDNGIMTKEVNRETIQNSFYEFYQNRRNGKDLERHKTRKNYKDWEPKDFWSLAHENPINFLCKTHKNIFVFYKGKSVMRIKLDIDRWLMNEFFVNQVKDCIEFRRIEFLDTRLR